MKGSRSRASPARFRELRAGAAHLLRGQDERAAVWGAHPAENPRPEEMRPAPGWLGLHCQSLRPPRPLLAGHHPRLGLRALPPRASAFPSEAYPRGRKQRQQPQRQQQQHKKAAPQKINNPQRHQNREANKPRRWRETAPNT